MAEGRTAYLGPVEKAFPFLSAQVLFDTLYLS